MEVYDLHCDTISAIYEGRKDGKDLFLASSGLQVDLEKMEKGDYRLQTFAIFLDRANTENCFATAGEMTDLFKKELEKNCDKISQVYTYQDIQRNKAEGKMSALLSLLSWPVQAHGTSYGCPRTARCFREHYIILWVG